MPGLPDFLGELRLAALRLAGRRFAAALRAGFRFAAFFAVFFFAGFFFADFFALPRAAFRFFAMTLLLWKNERSKSTTTDGYARQKTFFPE
jgi:hypothetical protein